jgi:hypothetical protein
MGGVDDNTRIETLSKAWEVLSLEGSLEGRSQCARSPVLSFEAANNGRQRSPVETFRTTGTHSGL